MIRVPASLDEDLKDNYRRDLFLAQMNIHEKEVGIVQLYISAHHFPPETVSEGKTRLLRPTMTWEEYGPLNICRQNSKIFSTHNDEGELYYFTVPCISNEKSIEYYHKETTSNGVHRDIINTKTHVKYCLGSKRLIL